VNHGRVLSEISAFLDEKRLRHAIVGALALSCHGLPRATQDVDLLLDAAAQETMVAFLVSLGYETVHRSAGYSNHLHPLEAMGRVDVLYVVEPTATSIFQRAKVIEFSGHRLSVPCPEHLSAMKAFAVKNDPARSLQDLADVQHLLGLPGVDIQEIRAYFREYDLEDRFDEILRLTQDD